MSGTLLIPERYTVVSNWLEDIVPHREIPEGTAPQSAPAVNVRRALRIAYLFVWNGLSLDLSSTIDDLDYTGDVRRGLTMDETVELAQCLGFLNGIVFAGSPGEVQLVKSVIAGEAADILRLVAKPVETVDVSE